MFNGPTQPRRLCQTLVLVIVVVCGLSCAPAHSSPVARLPGPERELTPAASSEKTRIAVLAGGCFWCMEAVFEQLAGVSRVRSGFAGGRAADADYERVAAGATRHAEVVEITYDPARISYGALLQVFFSVHDPTQRNRQGPDSGPQYRSAIFYATTAERAVAQAYIQQLTAAKVFDKPIATTLEAFERFYPAGDEHQDFVARHPHHPYVRAWVPAKLNKLRTHYPELLP